MEATEKQLKNVLRIIEYFGKDEIYKYINKYFKDVNMDKLTKQQAQKIISGWNMKFPIKPIENIYGRDFNIFY